MFDVTLAIMQSLSTAIAKLLRKNNAAGFFLVFASFFGLITIFLSPPMQPADETLHYWRAYQLSNFDILADKFSEDRFGYKIPSEIKSITDSLSGGITPKARLDLEQMYKVKSWNNYYNNEIVYFENTAINSPVGYIPYAITLLFGRLVELPHLVVFYLARVMGLIFYIGICYAAIRIAPKGKLIMASIALLPMSLYLASAISIDAILISLTLLAVALTMRLSIGYKKTDRKFFLLLIAVLALLSITKTGYFILSLLLFTVPKEHFGRKAWSTFILLATTGLIAGLGIFWNTLVFDVANTIHTVLRPGEYINVTDQIEYIKSNPIQTIGAFLNTYLLKSSTILVMSFVGIFGWLDIVMPFFAYLIFGMLIYYHLQKSELLEKPMGTLAANKVYVLTALLITGYMTVSLYVGYNVVGSNFVEGLQGRYFIPIVALLVPLFVEREKIKNKNVLSLYLFTTVLLLLVMIFSIANANILRINY